MINIDIKLILNPLFEFGKSFVQRKKIGFSMPINKWLHDDQVLGSFVNILKEERTLSREFYNPEGIKVLLKDFESGRDQNKYSIAGRVWILLNFELWIRSLIENKNELV